MNDLFNQSENELEDHELQHYGVPGMKWGVRRVTANRQAKVSRRKQLVKANANYIAKGSPQVTYSNKTVNRARAGVGLFIAGTGTYALSSVIRDPRVRAGAQAVSILLNSASMVSSVAAIRSGNTDIIEQFGD